MATLTRISAAETKARIDNGLALLVCIYEDDRFQSQAHLEGAIPMSKFLEMKPGLAKDADIIFY
jgi:D-Tyr-tRNAtyr deacylase